MQQATSAADGKEGRGGGGANARQRPGALYDAIEELKALLGSGIGALRDWEIRDKEMIRLEARRNFLKARKTAEKQTGADQ